jgi:ABC-type branched-subunit amino acid transport system permease subunit
MLESKTLARRVRAQHANIAAARERRHLRRLTGTVYGLMALGLSAIFGVIRLVNFAHGELMTLAMYTAVVAFQGSRWIRS